MDNEWALLVDRLVSHERTAALVLDFFDRAGPFEGDLLYTIPHNEPYQVTLEDLFAVTLLNVSVGPSGVRRLLFDEQSRERTGRLLQAIPLDIDIWQADEMLKVGSVLEVLWRELQKEGDRIGPVTAGKILARKRPRLVPIVDRVVEELLGTPSPTHWRMLGSYLQDERRRSRLESLRPSALKGTVPVLRILDVVVWMWGSRGRAARRARERLGIPPLGFHEFRAI